MRHYKLGLRLHILIILIYFLLSHCLNNENNIFLPTSEILSAQTPSDTAMLGRNVAVLKDRLHDISCVAKHGGIIRPGTIDHTIRGINELIRYQTFFLLNMRRKNFLENRRQGKYDLFNLLDQVETIFKVKVLNYDILLNLLSLLLRISNNWGGNACSPGAMTWTCTKILSGLLCLVLRGCQFCNPGQIAFLMCYFAKMAIN